jgi:hypothetical protein
MKRLFPIFSAILAVAFPLLTASQSAFAQKVAGANRPASVPQGYLITPFGYFHPSCVRSLATGDTLLADGRVQHADGSVDQEAPACGYPHYTAAGEAMGSGLKTPNIRHSWIVSANAINTTSSFGELTANWVVPKAPTTYHDQTVFLFPGMEDYADVETIIQPVLGWNAGFFGTSWSIASWNCCPGGTANYSTPVEVKSGDMLFGTIKNTCQAGTKSCSRWDITTEDVTANSSTTLSRTPSEGQTFTWAQGAALEVYGIVECSDYPPADSTAFFNLALYDNNLNQYSNPGWILFNYATGLTPQCNYGGTMWTKRVRLDY